MYIVVFSIILKFDRFVFDCLHSLLIVLIFHLLCRSCKQLNSLSKFTMIDNETMHVSAKFEFLMCFVYRDKKVENT
jgi:hypothetical protein